MKKLISTLFVFALLFAIFPVEQAAAAPYRVSNRDADGWPNWIGRLHTVSLEKYICGDMTPCRVKLNRPTMASKYLPLSLVKTGKFRELVGEVSDTPNVDTTGWPSWIGEIVQ